MKGLIYSFGLISGALGGLIGLFMFVGIQGARNVGELVLGILIIPLFLSFSVGGLFCLSFKHWARRLLIISSSAILLLLCGNTLWNSFNNNPGNWDVVGHAMIYTCCAILICNLFVFTRRKVKEQFK